MPTLMSCCDIKYVWTTCTCGRVIKCVCVRVRARINVCFKARGLDMCRPCSQTAFHHHHKHQELDPLISSVSRFTTALANVSSVFQLFSFPVVCSDMISKEVGLVAFFASVKAGSVCIHLSCPVCIHGVRSRLFCGNEGCNLPEVSITSFLPLQYWSCASSGDSELGRVSSGRITSPSLSEFGGS
jgi:hypothetical protein